MADTPTDQPKSDRTSMEVGGTGTAKASFKDALGADVKIVSSTWTSTSPGVTVTPVDNDPVSATLEATHPGHAAIHVTVQSESGHTGTAATQVMVIETGTPADGKIELTVQPAPAKASA